MTVGRLIIILLVLGVLVLSTVCCIGLTVWGVTSAAIVEVEVPAAEAPAAEVPAAEAPAAEAPAAEVPAAEAPEVPDSCALLGTEGMVCFPREASAGAEVIPVYEGGFTLVAVGNATINSFSVSTDGTVGNILLIPGRDEDGGTPGDLNDMEFVLEKNSYVSGAVGITSIWEVTEYGDMLKAAMSAAENMFNAPNCGQEGCNVVNVYKYNWTVGEFELYKTLTR